MRRRSFIKSAGVLGALTVPATGLLATAFPSGAPCPPVTPVFERLPDIIAAKQGRDQQAATRANEGDQTADNWGVCSDRCNRQLYPLLIALGPRAERVIEQAQETLAIPKTRDSIEPAESAMLHPTGCPCV